MRCFCTVFKQIKTNYLAIYYFFRLVADLFCTSKLVQTVAEFMTYVGSWNFNWCYNFIGQRYEVGNVCCCINKQLQNIWIVSVLSLVRHLIDVKRQFHLFYRPNIIINKSIFIFGLLIYQLSKT